MTSRKINLLARNEEQVYFVSNREAYERIMARNAHHCPLCHLTTEGVMSDKATFLAEYQKYKNQLMGLEQAGEGNSRTAHQIRGTLIPLWNRLTPEQQKEMAMKYIPQENFLP